ncbi:hypothetical protein HYW75_03405 [Candidatus Pacearchaeota archaeon]|nr:hypothetical protein [Candidatus Pacearchaeota archaeon]
MIQNDINYAQTASLFWNMDDSVMLNYIRQAHVKNSGINSGACLEFLSTSKIIFAFSQTKVRSLCKNNFLSIKNLSIVKILSPLHGDLMPFYEVEVIGKSNPVYQVKQPKQFDRRWLDMPNRK